jgi:prepilin-type N-terminal cleavage/methylation domain-containing protein
MRIRPAGFTLIELLYALLIAGVLGGAVMGLILAAQKSSGGLERKVAAQQDVRAALEIMALEIAMASYNPTFQTDIWVDPNGCANLSPNQPGKGIQAASPTNLVVEMDISENSRIYTKGVSKGADCDTRDKDCNEIIIYRYNLEEQFVSRAVNCGPAMPFLGARPSSGTTRNVRVVNNDLKILNGMGTAAVFRYFDARDPAGELYPDQNPADYANIRRIEITLGVETDEPGSGTGSRRRMIYSTSVIPRNHALSP